MNISERKVGYLTYILKDNNNGEILETIEAENPQAFLFGAGFLLEAFEKSLDGLKAGDDFEFILSSDKAYGIRDPHAVFDIPKNTFEINGTIDEGMLKPGSEIPMRDNNGNQHMGRVIGIQSDHVIMDFNHPLSGKDLHFSGRVTRVRDANDAELKMMDGQDCGSHCGCGDHQHETHDHSHHQDNCQVCGNPPEKQGQGNGSCRCT